MISKLKITFAAALLCIAMPALAVMDDNDHHPAKDGSAHQDHHNFEQHLKYRLNKLSNRLEIKASQEAAWEEYAKSVEALAEHHEKKPEENADAATISRERADRATEFAQKLTKIADSTSKLQTVLTEDQQKVFNQVTRHSQHHRKCRGWKGHRDFNHEWHHKINEKEVHAKGAHAKETQDKTK